MDALTPATADDLFSPSYGQSTQMTTLVNQALTNGIDKYTNKDYKGAAKEFQRAYGLDPFSDHSVDAIKYLAMSYIQLNEPDKAIQAFRQGIQTHPNDDGLQTALGNLYFGEGNTGDAITAYEAAVRSYDDANNRFSLGQGYLKAGRYDDAAEQFNKVIQMTPNSPNGYFGLGQTLAAQKKYADAIAQFQRAYRKDNTFYDAYSEMGYAYADSGDMQKAAEVQSDLQLKDSSLAQTLGQYINSKTQPQIMFAWPDSPFAYYLPPKTNVAALSNYMANANASQSFSIVLQFSKAMDRESVENPTNWTIQRSRGNGPGMEYNSGLQVPSTEAQISPYPTDIYYDDTDYTATVRFTLSQNASADATIDPSHIVFSYKGVDADGNRMNPKYDQFMGFSGSF
jgi:tetratricopeptide (TPR) repeat protein